MWYVDEREEASIVSNWEVKSPPPPPCGCNKCMALSKMQLAAPLSKSRVELKRCCRNIWNEWMYSTKFRARPETAPDIRSGWISDYRFLRNYSPRQIIPMQILVPICLWWDTSITLLDQANQPCSSLLFKPWGASLSQALINPNKLAFLLTASRDKAFLVKSI